MTVRSAGELADELADLDDLTRVEADRRLVEHEHRRIVDQRLRQADALPEALGEVAEQPTRGRRVSPHGCQ